MNPQHDPGYMMKSLWCTGGAFARFLADLPDSADKVAAIACFDVARARANAAVAIATGDRALLKAEADKRILELACMGLRMEMVVAYLAHLEGVVARHENDATDKVNPDAWKPGEPMHPASRVAADLDGAKQP